MMSKKKKVFLILVISFLAVIVLFFSLTASGQSLIYSLIFEPDNDYTVLDSYGFVFPLEHPNTCTRGDEKCSSIAICEPELGKKYENTYFIYSIKQKNIISSYEIELNWL